ncbi:MAG: ribosomal protein S18-alanine N-acetyltransferase [Candidatus Latescibacterota bacterium]
MPGEHPKLQIRLMRSKDLPGVLRIERETFSNPWPRRELTAAMEDPDCQAIVGREDGILVGYGMAWFLSEEVHIGNLAVAKPHRRKGIASTLLRHILAQAGKAHMVRVTLEVRISNEAAQALYRAHGFLEVAIRRAYYFRPTEDALVMMKSL